MAVERAASVAFHQRQHFARIGLVCTDSIGDANDLSAVLRGSPAAACFTLHSHVLDLVAAATKCHASHAWRSSAPGYGPYRV